MWLLQFPSAFVLEHTLLVNVFTGAKHCWNLDYNTFSINLGQIELENIYISHIQNLRTAW